MKRRITVSEVADYIGASHSGVLNLIHAGQLPAINVAPNGKRASYRVLLEDVEAFEEGRAVQSPAPKRRRAKPLNQVREFIT